LKRNRHDRIKNRFKEIVELLSGGMNIAEAVIPKTTATSAPQLLHQFLMHGPIQINLAVEDLLSEQMLRTALEQCGNYQVGAVYRKGGQAYLKSKLIGFNRAAKGMPYLMLTDLDRRPCATHLIEEWFDCETEDYGARRHPNLVFLIAVREKQHSPSLHRASSVLGGFIPKL
jgi:hypothetical protein